jgi:hypothetical protein
MWTSASFLQVIGQPLYLTIFENRRSPSGRRHLHKDREAPVDILTFPFVAPIVQPLFRPVAPSLKLGLRPDPRWLRFQARARLCWPKQSLRLRHPSVEAACPEEPREPIEEFVSEKSCSSVCQRFGVSFESRSSLFTKQKDLRPFSISCALHSRLPEKDFDQNLKLQAPTGPSKAVGNFFHFDAGRSVSFSS